MGSDEEQSRIELAICEQIKEPEVVLEKLAETVDSDSSSISPDINEVAVTITTDVASETTELSHKMSLSMIPESSLTEEQKKLATQIYDSTKEAIKEFIADPSLNSTVKITRTIGQIIKQLEGVKIDGKAPSGVDKKAVAIQLGRILIKEVTPDDKGEVEILMMYDLVAEPTLEAMIDVSRVVNIAVQEIATKCCPSLFDFLKRYNSVKTAKVVTK